MGPDWRRTAIRTKRSSMWGAGMGRYHLFRDCHYISNEYQSVTQMEAEKAGAMGKANALRSVCGKGKRIRDRLCHSSGGTLPFR